MAEVEEVENHDPYFEPLVNLPKIEIQTLEEDEDDFVKLRAKLFRYASEEDPPEWKERGTGDVKILQHKESKLCRVLMRRDKTLKICANHYVLPHMELRPNCGSDRAWVWRTTADFADEEEKSEMLAIRFANVENAQKFNTAFEKAKKEMEKLTSNGVLQQAKKPEESNGKEEKASAEKSDKSEDEEVASRLKDLSVKDTKTENNKDSSSTDGPVVVVNGGEGGGDNTRESKKEEDKTESSDKK